MLQLIALLLISWLLIYLFQKGNLSVLGLTPTKERSTYFAILFILSGAFSALAFLLRMYIAKEEYILDETLTLNTAALEVWYQFRSVFTEELICRGALLYILVKRIGSRRAIVVSSVIFAILHWLNAGVWGDLTQMVVVFSFTFAMGLLLAYAYVRTFSILIPFAIHFGWNLTQNYIFPDVATGNHVFILVTPPPVVTISYFAFFTMLLLPKISVLVFNFLVIKTHRQVEMP